MTEARRTHPGLLVTFEGGEGAGKSTQLELLASRVRGIGREVLTAREPGGTSLGELLRPLTRKPATARRFYRLLTGDTNWSRLTPLSELFLYEASRAQLVAELIRPGLERGAVAILDRFTDSTLAYQGYGRGLDLDNIRTVNRIATGGLRPDMTFLLDLDVSLGLSRKRGESGRDAIGGEDSSFHERVRAGYLSMAAEEPERWIVLDASLPPALLSGEVWRVVEPILAGESNRL